MTFLIGRRSKRKPQIKRPKPLQTASTPTNAVANPLLAPMASEMSMEKLITMLAPAANVTT